MKESYYTQERPRSLVFRETFSSESECINNGGDPTDVTFDNGIGSFNGSSSVINYSPQILNDFTVRARVKFNAISGDVEYIVSTNGAISGTYLLAVNNTNFYFNIGGLETQPHGLTLNNTDYYEFIITRSGDEIFYYADGVYIGADTGVGTASTTFMTLGKKPNFASYFNGDMELVELYNYKLSDEEVANLYNNSRFIKPTGSSLLEITAENGVIEDRIGNSFTNTDVEVVRDGEIFAHAYNGSSSSLASAATIPPENFTICLWVKFNSLDITANTTLITAGATRFYLRQNSATTARVQYYDGTTNLVISLTNTISLEWFLYTVVFNTVTKTLSLYKDSVLLGQSSNLSFVNPAASSYYIGSYTTGTFNLNGKIGEVIINDTLWSAEQISRYYSSTKHKYYK